MAAHSHQPATHERGSERGAILIHVAIAMIVLIAFTSFVADYGLMWVGRRQAQNSADAGALAGAIALAYDDFTDRTDTGPAKVSAHTVALANDIVEQDPDVNISTDIAFVNCPDDPSPPPIAETPCIRVDVFRNQDRNNPLQVWFSQFVGVTDQGVRATAIARAGWGDASNCMKPWAIPDKWIDYYDDSPENPGNTPPEWTDGDEFEPDEDVAPAMGDEYRLPGTNGPNDPGTGFTVEADEGTYITLKHGSPHDAISPSHFYPIVLPGTGPGGSEYRESIATCRGGTIPIGSLITVEPGNMIGPTKLGVGDLIALDEDAFWHDPDGNGPEVGFVSRPGVEDEDGNPAAVSESARIVCVPAFDINAYWDSRMHGRMEIVISNILGFFIDDMVGNDVGGYLTKCPGIDSGTTHLPGASAFIPIIQLVR